MRPALWQRLRAACMHPKSRTKATSAFPTDTIDRLVVPVISAGWLHGGRKRGRLTRWTLHHFDSSCSTARSPFTTVHSRDEDVPVRARCAPALSSPSARPRALTRTTSSPFAHAELLLSRGKQRVGHTGKKFVAAQHCARCCAWPFWPAARQAGESAKARVAGKLEVSDQFEKVRLRS